MERSDPSLIPSLMADPAAPAVPGARRLGSIELQRVLTSTGHAVLHQAWDHGLSRPVLVEEYFPPALAQRTADGRVQPLDRSATERFEQGRTWFVDAWRGLARCDHPALVRVLLLLEAHGTAFAVMPAQAGELLAAQAARFPLEAPLLQRLIDDLLGALETCHAAGRPHGDLRPETVRWQEGGRALLVSPGAAQPDGADALPDVAAGVAADLLALARLARFCVTGVLPRALAPGAPVPLDAAIEQLSFEMLAGRYGVALQRLLQEPPPTVAQWRAELGAAPPIPPPVPPAAARARAAAAPAPARTVPHPPPFTEPSFDPSTEAHIQRVRESFGAPGERGRRPPIEAPAFAAGRPYAPLPDEMEPRRWPLWLGLAVVAAAFGVGVWQMDRRPPAGVRIAAPNAPTAAPAVPPVPVPPPDPAPIPAPAPPVAALPLQPAPPIEPEAAPPTSAGPAAPAPPPAAPPAAAPAPPPAPPPVTRPRATAAAAPSTPRALCGERTQFSLYRCMRQICSTGRWHAHPQCARLRATDSAD